MIGEPEVASLKFQRRLQLDQSLVASNKVLQLHHTLYDNTLLIIFSEDLMHAVKAYPNSGLCNVVCTIGHLFIS